MACRHWLLRLLFTGAALAGAGLAIASGPDPDTQSAVWLHAKYVLLADRLQHNPFHSGLALDSSESGKDLKGDIYAVVEYPFGTVSAALDGPEEWCDLMILHINTKFCHARTDARNTILAVSIGRKFAQPLDDAYPLDFLFRVVAEQPAFLDVQLDARTGPVGTSNYLIRLQAIPIENGRTFLHLTYSYAYGFAGKLAMNTYLATLGSDKVGFTTTGRQANGEPGLIGGVRGVVERNTMRYYLAINAYLGGLAVSPSLRLEHRLQAWFTASEQYARQLHEVDRTAYLDMKRKEYVRQQTDTPVHPF